MRRYVGVNMICETPIAINLPCADLMIKAADGAGVKLEIAENYYRMPSERAKLKLVREGKVGEVLRVYNINYRHCYHGMSLIRLCAVAKRRVFGGRPKVSHWEKGRSNIGITPSSILKMEQLQFMTSAVLALQPL